ncbi:MAG: phosphoglycerate kinase [Solirubrobacteraceae bacterium]|nr:phosphoglycerate kinase [Solirubrobacteraceae bacterium]
MRTLSDLGDVAGQRVLVRVDFNVPLDNDGNVTDDTRIRSALPTIEWLRERDAKVVLVSHLGRPKGEVNEKFSLKPAGLRLAALLDAPVQLADAVVGPEVEAEVAKLADGEVLLLENVRFEPGETTNDPELAKQLAALADVYVNDAFGAAHRAHASTEGVAHLVERKAAGLLLQREVETLTKILSDPARPLVAIVGGAKVTDKIGVIDRFLQVADAVIIGGAMGFPFAKAQGHAVGNSLCEEEGIEPATRALAEGGDKLKLPIDLRLGREFSADTETQDLDGLDVPDGWMGLDIGPKTAAAYAEIIRGAATVFWNGPMGAFELEPFSEGTREVALAVADCPGTTVVGGGDSVAAVVQFGLEDRVTHVSTGGGASLELIEGRKLPGVEALA